MKITVVGAGAVGATVADNIARRELCEELVLLDIKEGLAEGKSLDMMQTAALLGFDTKITCSTRGIPCRSTNQFGERGAAYHGVGNDLLLLVGAQEIADRNAVPGSITDQRDHGGIAMPADHHRVQVGG